MNKSMKEKYRVPLKDVAWHNLEQMKFGAEALAARPKLIGLVGQCIAASSELESELAVFLGMLLKTPTYDAGITALFLTLKKAHIQKEAIQVVAKTVLEKEDYNAVADFLKRSDVLTRERNKLAHSLFAVSTELPDGIIVIEPKAAIGPVFKISSGDEDYRHILAMLDDAWIYTSAHLSTLLLDFINYGNELEELTRNIKISRG